MSADDKISKLLHEYKSILDSYYQAPDCEKVKLYQKLLNIGESIDPQSDAAKTNVARKKTESIPRKEG